MTSAIIVDYKSAVLTGHYVRHAHAMLDTLRRFVIVDNSLSDENFMLLASQWSGEATSVQEEDIATLNVGEPLRRLVRFTWKEAEIVLAQPEENLGFARGNNLAMRIDRMLLGSDRYLITNNDIEIHDRDALARLERILSEKPEVLSAGPAIIGLDGAHQSPHRYVGLFSRWIFPYAFWYVNSVLWRISKKFVERVSSDIAPQDSAGPVYRLIGAFMLADAERMHRIGLFDPVTFLYAEEMILAERARHAGLTMWYEPSFHVTHEQGVTTRNVYSMERQLKQRFQSEKLYYGGYLGKSPFALKLADWSISFYVHTWVRPRMKKLEA